MIPARSSKGTFAKVVGVSIDETRLGERFGPQIVYFALRRLRDWPLAEEVAQKTLLAVIQALRDNRLRDESKLPAFVFAVAKNMILEIYRKRYQEAEANPDLEMNFFKPWIPDPEAGFLLEEQRKEVGRALARLRPIEREILRLSFEEGKTGADIAKELRMGQAAVRKRKSRALARLKRIYIKMSRKTGL